LMLGETVAAVLVGLAAVYVVVSPLLARRPPRQRAMEPPDPEETPKGIALTALREIEFDKETGKLSDADYEELKARYTAAAVEALRQETALADDVAGEVAAASMGGEDTLSVGRGPEDAACKEYGDVEAMIAVRAHALRSARAATSSDSAMPASSFESAAARAAECESCGPRPEADALFCSTCGRRLQAGPACASCGALLVPDSRYCGACGTRVAA
jgi:hypothetical protein